MVKNGQIITTKTIFVTSETFLTQVRAYFWHIYTVTVIFWHTGSESILKSTSRSLTAYNTWFPRNTISQPGHIRRKLKISPKMLRSRPRSGLQFGSKRTIFGPNLAKIGFGRYAALSERYAALNRDQDLNTPIKAKIINFTQKYLPVRKSLW